jgi:hypothetical protein
MIIVSNFLIGFLELFAPIKIRAVALFPFIVIPSITKTDDILINHERIHLRQQIELLIIPFYIWYLIEGAIKGYRNICFEREAFNNEKDLDYLKNRDPWSFLKYMNKKTPMN